MPLMKRAFYLGNDFENFDLVLTSFLNVYLLHVMPDHFSLGNALKPENIRYFKNISVPTPDDEYFVFKRFFEKIQQGDELFVVANFNQLEDIKIHIYRQQILTLVINMRKDLLLDLFYEI